MGGIFCCKKALRKIRIKKQYLKPSYADDIKKRLKKKLEKEKN